MLRTLSLLAVLLLAGCATPQAPPPAAPAAGVPALAGFDYACPPGPTMQQGGVCVGRIASLTESNQEPYLAIHPHHPEVMAVGVNAGPTVTGIDPSRGVGFDLVRHDLFLTEDGGATWRHTTLPAFPVPGAGEEAAFGFRVAGDPAMVFDGNGTLHLSVLVSSDSMQHGYGIAYLATPDLGRTWSKPVVFTTDDDNDRNWIALGPDGALYVTWQNVGSSSQMAWSLDGGHTWQVQTARQVVTDCITTSPALVTQQVLVACAGYDRGQGDEFADDEFTGIQVHAFDPATGDFTLVALVEDMPCLWPMLAQVGHTLALAADYCERSASRLAASHDGGATWQKPLELTTQAGDVAKLMWVASDPWGGLHLLGIVPEYTLPIGVGRLEQPHLVHLVLDERLDVLHDALLRPASLRTELPDAAPVSYGDHFYGLDFHDAGGVAVWTRGHGLDFTVVEPVVKAALHTSH